MINEHIVLPMQAKCDRLRDENDRLRKALEAAVASYEIAPPAWVIEARAALKGTS